MRTLIAAFLIVICSPVLSISQDREPEFNSQEYYQIINKVSGFGLLPAWSGERPTERGMHHWPMGQRGQNQNGFLWKIRPVRDGYYKIINKVSRFGLLPQYSGDRPQFRGMHHWPMGQKGQNQNGFLWKIKRAR